MPNGGLCLSAFLVLSDKENSNTVLMGRLNPEAPWDHIGALDESRIRMFKEGWMLPSSHLLIHESPQEAATRIEKEQLGLRDLRLAAPIVASEVYTSKRFPDRPDHWDFEFIFRGTVGRDEVSKFVAWKELKFIDPEKTPASGFARSHEDILAHAGFKFGPH